MVRKRNSRVRKRNSRVGKRNSRVRKRKRRMRKRHSSLRKRKRNHDDSTVATAIIVPNFDTNLCLGWTITEFVPNPEETKSYLGVATTEIVPHLNSSN